MTFKTESSLLSVKMLCQKYAINVNSVFESICRLFRLSLLINTNSNLFFANKVMLIDY